LDRHVVIDEDRSTGLLTPWNCPNIQQLTDGRILLLADRVLYPPGEWGIEDQAQVFFWFSEDEGSSFSEPEPTSIRGICPDQVTVLPGDRWLLATNFRVGDANRLTQMLFISHDAGVSWDQPMPMNEDPNHELDEASIVKMPGGELVSYEREDLGRPLQKLISIDNGATWAGPYDTLNPAAHGCPSQISRRMDSYW
jgi:hypothetical protein